MHSFPSLMFILTANNTIQSCTKFASNKVENNIHSKSQIVALQNTLSMHFVVRLIGQAGTDRCFTSTDVALVKNTTSLTGIHFFVVSASRENTVLRKNILC